LIHSSRSSRMSHRATWCSLAEKSSGSPSSRAAGCSVPPRALAPRRQAQNTLGPRGSSMGPGRPR